jgi:myo-inositol-1(or 4)-monophosphatase
MLGNLVARDKSHTGQPMNPLLNIAVAAARRAGDIIARQSRQTQSLRIDSKQRHDFVTQVDRQAENEIIKTIRKAHPDHAILAEESGPQGQNEVTWIIDPLDGTTNFIHEIPHYAVSIAVRWRARLEHAVVYDPVKLEMYTASRGSGAFLNDRRVRVAGRTGLENAVIGTGIPFRDMSYADAYFPMLREIAGKTAGIRRAGAAALDLAYVAAGRLDGFWEFGLQPWDMAAGVLLVQEAGGVNGDPAGGTAHLDTGHIACGNPKVFAALVRECKPRLTTALREQLALAHRG